MAAAAGRRVGVSAAVAGKKEGFAARGGESVKTRSGGLGERCEMIEHGLLARTGGRHCNERNCSDDGRALPRGGIGHGSACSGMAMLAGLNRPLSASA